MGKTYDVIICGGGLAGLTLGLQLKKESVNNISILILDRRNEELAAATHKVGESTVELGAHYLAQTIGLKNYLEENHLPKYGLRFWFCGKEANSTIHESIEYGSRLRPPVNKTYQIDRGILENDLVKFCREAQIDVRFEAEIQSVDLDKNVKTVGYKSNNGENTVYGKWLVDATGQRAFISRSINQETPTGHECNAVWFRIDEKIDLDDWFEHDASRERCPSEHRLLATNHFMGEGYWVWVIPLPNDKTSIGIVADPKYHAFRELISLEKAMAWLSKNEPVCYRFLKPLEDKVLDFKMAKNYPWNSKEYYSNNRWGIVGVAASFSDPFYSPGTDFIAMGNTWLSDLIISDLSGDSIAVKTKLFNNIHHILLDNFLDNYRDMYGVFGNPYVMQMKVLWDFSTYWSFTVLLAMNHGYTDMNILQQIKKLGKKYNLLNRSVQAFFAKMHTSEITKDEPDSGFSINYSDVPFLISFFLDLACDFSEKELLKRLHENIRILEEVAAEMFRVTGNRYYQFPERLKINPYNFSLNFSKEHLLEIAQQEGAIDTRIDIQEQLAYFLLYDKKSILQEPFIKDIKVKEIDLQESTY